MKNFARSFSLLLFYSLTLLLNHSILNPQSRHGLRRVDSIACKEVVAKGRREPYPSILIPQVLMVQG
jgi:hypothetical protein